ncbi:hypothetical protein D3C83_01630 [compost metagenome]
MPQARTRRGFRHCAVRLDRAGDLDPDLHSGADGSLHLAGVELRDDAAGDPVRIRLNVLFDDGDAVRGDGDDDGGVMRARQLPPVRFVPLAVDVLPRADVDDMVAELQDVSRLDRIEQDAVAPVVVGGLRHRHAAIGGGLGAERPEQHVDETEAVDAELARQRLAADPLLGGGFQPGRKIVVRLTHGILRIRPSRTPALARPRCRRVPAYGRGQGLRNYFNVCGAGERTGMPVPSQRGLLVRDR